MRLAVLSFTLLVAACNCAPTNQSHSKPNIVWFLTDDQDQMLGASFPLVGDSTPMPKTQKLMQQQGATATNWYIHTPICSPSRSELVTGRYFHNIKLTGSAKGYCSGMHVNYTTVNDNTFAKNLNEAGYTVGMFGEHTCSFRTHLTFPLATGKYVNEMPNTVPAGFDAWMANGGGDYIAPNFMTKNIDGVSMQPCACAWESGAMGVSDILDRETHKYVNTLTDVTMSNVSFDGVRWRMGIGKAAPTITPHLWLEMSRSPGLRRWPRRASLSWRISHPRYTPAPRIWSHFPSNYHTMFLLRCPPNPSILLLTIRILLPTLAYYLSPNIARRRHTSPSYLHHGELGSGSAQGSCCGFFPSK